MRNVLLLPLALAALWATTAAGANEAGLTTARLRQRVSVAGSTVTPLRVLEDSRCPMEARCVWAGQVRLLVRIGTGRHRAVREITSNRPISVAGGALELVSVMPPNSVQRPIRARDYRFAFRFARSL